MPRQTLEKRIRAAQLRASDSGAQDWDYGDVAVLQHLIDSGAVWALEGSAGRAASHALSTGACFLPAVRSRDYWGNTIPSRNELVPGSKGTLANSARFYGL